MQNIRHSPQNGVSHQQAPQNHSITQEASTAPKSNSTAMAAAHQSATGTFEKLPFDQLITQYDNKHRVMPTLELSQALLMTSNLKDVAAAVQSATQGSTGYFFRNDYVAEAKGSMNSMAAVNRLLRNIGTGDKAVNFLVNQRNLMRAQAKEASSIRKMIDKELVDGQEYMRVREQIAQCKQRTKQLLIFSSDDESKEHQQNLQKNAIKEEGEDVTSSHQQDTEEDSQEAKMRRRQIQLRIQSVIAQMRRDAKQYLPEHEAAAVEQMSVSQLYHKLARNKKYRRRKRDTKAIQKQKIAALQKTAEQLRYELKSVQEKTKDINMTKDELQTKISSLEQVLGIEKRLKKDVLGTTVAELDSKQMNAVSHQMQGQLMSFFNVQPTGKRVKQFSQKAHDKVFGKIKRIKLNSVTVDGDEITKEAAPEAKQFKEDNVANRRDEEYVKVIGLEPEKLFKSLSKYQVKVELMPKFSNTFDSYEKFIPGLGVSTTSNQTLATQGANLSVTNFARIDGRNVISLNFNPYELDTDQKKKIYEGSMKDINEQREKAKSLNKASREKQEAQNIKRVWTNIAKKDIPKAYRAYQKVKTDTETNTKKFSTACLKEVRKRAVKTQRLAKENVVRAKKLTKEMLTFWKRRDKEIADLKRKKEKQDKEIKKRQQEEEEALLQKKRLEYLMKQSEIYAHFMANKMGMQGEQNKQREVDMEDEKRTGFNRVDVDDHSARQNIAHMINENRQRLQDFDEEGEAYNKVDEEELDDNLFGDPAATDSKIIQQPTILQATLKEYQLKGLRWLDNLYEQGINGILADEMGLGKTIQAISLLAHIAESKGTWGPFLVVVPVTTLHNWQNELARFCPSLKVLPYFGSPEERKKLGKFLDPKSLNNPNLQIHVLITSYNLVVNNPKDQAKLQKIKWNYMILDEAQAVKNSGSRRWKVLLNFQTRNRLLLTGTPIQNSMAELWALLHFIMPKLFDNHEQFQEWFSKDIESHSMNQGELNKHQLKRLHLVLKPFMLRRLKKDVEQEIGPKKEYEIFCDMTHRQKVLYDRIRSKISTKDLFQLTENKAKMENLMNLVMQFRKVCNHPDLFERRVGRIPYSFRDLQTGVQPNQNISNNPEVRMSMRNPIEYKVPQLIADELFLISDNNTRTFTKLIPYEDLSMCSISYENHMRMFNIFNEKNMSEQCLTSGSGFGILRLLMNSNKWSFSEMAYLMVADPMMRAIALMHYFTNKYKTRIYQHIHNADKQVLTNIYSLDNQKTRTHIDLQVIDFINHDSGSLLYNKQTIISQVNQSQDIIPPFISENIADETMNITYQMSQDLQVYSPPCLADTIYIFSQSHSFMRFITSATNNPQAKKVLIGRDFKPANRQELGRVNREQTPLFKDNYQSINRSIPCQMPILEKGVIPQNPGGSNIIKLPCYSRLVTDCAKMKVFADLMTRLQKEGHRVLVFCQMTRMLDILEDYLNWKKFSYFRMDGSTQTFERRFMVEEFQSNPQIFAFLLSTRAGGLGINLIAADTVIFYDNDWNPTMDEQATDRAHRIGQTKEVSVYRIVTRRTVEERIVMRAQQKQNVQSTVYGDTFKVKDVVQLVMDDDMADKVKKESSGFIRSRRKKKSEKDEAQLQSNTAAKKSTNSKINGFSKKAAMQSRSKQNGINGNAGLAAARTNGNNAQMFSKGKQDEEMLSDEEEIKRDKANKLLAMLQNRDDSSDEDDVGGAAVTFRMEEETNKPASVNNKTGGKTNGTLNKNGKNGAANGDLDEMMDEDDEMMVDEY